MSSFDTESSGFKKTAEYTNLDFYSSFSACGSAVFEVGLSIKYSNISFVMKLIPYNNNKLDRTNTVTLTYRFEEALQLLDILQNAKVNATIKHSVKTGANDKFHRFLAIGTADDMVKSGAKIGNSAIYAKTTYADDSKGNSEKKMSAVFDLDFELLKGLLIRFLESYISNIAVVKTMAVNIAAGGAAKPSNSLTFDVDEEIDIGDTGGVVVKKASKPAASGFDVMATVKKQKTAAAAPAEPPPAVKKKKVRFA